MFGFDFDDDLFWLVVAPVVVSVVAVVGYSLG